MYCLLTWQSWGAATETHCPALERKSLRTPILPPLVYFLFSFFSAVFWGGSYESRNQSLYSELTSFLKMWQAIGLGFIESPSRTCHRLRTSSLEEILGSFLVTYIPAGSRQIIKYPATCSRPHTIQDALKKSTCKQEENYIKTTF